MRNEIGKPLKMVTPATPVFTMGWKELPEPGEVVVQEKKSVYSSIVLEETSIPKNTKTQLKADDGLITVPLVVKGVGSVFVVLPVYVCTCTYLPQVSGVTTTHCHLPEYFYCIHLTNQNMKPPYVNQLLHDIMCLCKLT